MKSPSALNQIGFAILILILNLVPILLLPLLLKLPHSTGVFLAGAYYLAVLLFCVITMTKRRQRSGPP